MALEADRPFFSRQATKEAIATIASFERLTIYAGAGVTIDRSSLGWRQLVSGLMETYVPDADVRKRVLESATDLQAASIAAQLFRGGHGDKEYRNRLTDKLRVTLYNNEDWRVGTLAGNLAKLMFVLNERQIEDKGAAAPGTCIVTPNYDDYLWEEVRTQKESGKWLSEPDLRFSTRVEPLGVPGTPERNHASGWSDVTGFPVAGSSPCIHLHGFVTRRHVNATGEEERKYRHPVVSEQDYFDTYKPSLNALRKLFRQSSVLIVGASMTDPPLLRALADTAVEAAQAGYLRYALVPMQSELSADERTDIQQLLTERYRHFGVEPIYLDFYGQIPEFVNEITVAVEDEEGYFDRRYGRRLVSWWKDWIAVAGDPIVEADFLFHDILDMARIQIADELGVLDVEDLKIELWARRAPKTNRELVLWATSVGSIASERLMRRSPISLESGYSSVEALTAGRPVLNSVLDEKKRWKTLLSIPIRLHSQGCLTPVGAVTIGSMNDLRRSALNPSRNKNALVDVIDSLTNVGVALLTPSADEWLTRRNSLETAVYEDDEEELLDPTDPN